MMPAYPTPLSDGRASAPSYHHRGRTPVPSHYAPFFRPKSSAGETPQYAGYPPSANPFPTPSSLGLSVETPFSSTSSLSASTTLAPPSSYAGDQDDVVTIHGSEVDLGPGPGVDLHSVAALYGDGAYVMASLPFQTSQALSKVAARTDWPFRDGTLVLLSGDNMAFRVHWSLVVANAPGIGSEAKPVFDGTLYVYLQDVKGEDILAFLGAIYDASFLPPPPARVHANVIRRSLSTAHKFNAFPIRKRALAHLEAIAHNILARYIELRSDLGAVGRDAPTMIFVISCAREAHALWLLPSLLYELSTHAPTHDTHSGLSTLSPVDQHAIFNGFHCTQEPHYWDGLVMPGCDRSKCMKKRKELADATRNRFRQDPMYVADCIWLDCVWKDERVAKLCTLCREGLQHRMRGFAKSFREALPQELKLPGWEELSKECMVDMEGDGVVPRHPMVAPSEIRR